MKLYKYVPAARADILENGRIVFSLPSSFNDPFECSPVIAPVKNRNIIKAFDTKAFETRLQSLSPEHVPQTSRQLKKLRRSVREERKSLLPNLDKTLARGAQAAMTKGFATDLAVLCLCNSHDNLLMWAHYADHHKGFVIEFEAKDQGIQNLGCAHQVKYAEERPLHNFPQRGTLDLVLTKSTHWSYEQEYRILRKITELNCMEKDGRQLYYCDLPTDRISGIYLGARIAPEHAERVRRAILGKNVKCFEGKISAQRFEIEFSEISFPTTPSTPGFSLPSA